MKTEDIDEAILASLKKLGPSAPRRIADDAGIDPAKVTYAGTRLRKARLIKTAGATLNLVWALPEQKIEIAVDLDRPAARNKNTNKKRKAKAAAKPARQVARRGKIKRKARRIVADGLRSAARALEAKLDEQLVARLAAESHPLAKLRLALDEYLAVLTDMRQKLVGSTAVPLPT